jgi:biotin carboxyl carrier protein
MRYFVSLGQREIGVDVSLGADGRWQATVDGQNVPIDVVALSDPSGATGSRTSGALFSFVVDGHVLDLMVETSADGMRFAALSSRGHAEVESEWSRGAAGATHQGASDGPEVIRSPMPGRIVRVLVNPEQTIERGAPLVVVEAMKMENELRAARPGRVTEVLVQPGETVEAGARLVVLV